MTTKRIELLARALAQLEPRRRVLSGIAVLPAWTPGLLPGRVRAACKKVDQNCDRTSDCCDHARCRSGKCRCRRGFDECRGTCRDLATDERHCGACDFACSPGNTCCDGVCNGRLDQDEANCGACGNACPALLECVAGKCVLPAVGCPAGANSCGASGTIDPCGTGNCRCHQSTEGATVCIEPFSIEGGCGQCNASRDCLEFGADVHCIRTLGGTCCSQPPQNFCARQCPDPA